MEAACLSETLETSNDTTECKYSVYCHLNNWMTNSVKLNGGTNSRVRSKMCPLKSIKSVHGGIV